VSAFLEVVSWGYDTPCVFFWRSSSHLKDRRALFLAALVVGIVAGAFMHPGIGSANALVVSAVGKLVVTFSLLLNREQLGDEGRAAIP
jgi:hypothetical protein